MTDAPPPPGDPGGPPPPPPGYGSAPPPPAYGSAPPPPPGGQPAYGQPAYGEPTGYGQMPPAQQPYGAPSGPPSDALAGWGQRAQSAVIDWFGPSLVANIIGRASSGLGLLLSLLALAWAVYQAYLAGSTGQSLGRKIAGTRLANLQTGQNIGGGLSIGRYILHILDGIPLLAGFWLAPNVSKNKQTFADMIVKSVVVKV